MHMGMLYLTEDDAELILDALLRLRTDYELELQEGHCIALKAYEAQVQERLTRARRLCQVLEDTHVRSV
jgi:hypothetical protein